MVKVMTPQERVMQELSYPDVRQEVWLCQVHNPPQGGQPADLGEFKYRHWAKVMSGRPNNPMAFVLERHEVKRWYTARLEECY